MFLYQIFWNETAVGTADVTKEGLYYRFACTCRPVGEGIHKILVSDGYTQRNLGICVPVGRDFVLNTKIPAKSLCIEKLTFRIVPKEEEGFWIPVEEGMAFEYVDKLNSAYLKIIDGKKFIVINSTPGQPDSDRIQVHLNKLGQQ